MKLVLASPILVAFLPLTAFPQSHLPPLLLEALDDWRDSSNDAHWELVYDETPTRAGHAPGRLLFGGGYPTPVQSRPSSKAERFLLARDFVEKAYDIFFVDPASLVDDSTLDLPLGLVGGHDKVTVRLTQVIDGVPVEHGSVNLLFDAADWTLLSIDCMAVPTPPPVTTADVTAEDAAAVASAQFEAETGVEPAPVAACTLVICDHQTAGPKGVLAWKVEVTSTEAEDEAHAIGYCVAATDSPSIVEQEDRIHYFLPQQGGAPIRVKAWVTASGDCDIDITTCPNPCCYIPDNPNGSGRVLVKLPHLTVTDSVGQTRNTDASGELHFPGAVYPLTYMLKGPFVRVTNPQGVEGDLIKTSSAPGTIVLNPSQSEETVAQTNAFFRLNQMRDWVRSVNPFDDTMDSSSDTPPSVPYLARVNLVLTDFACCNAVASQNALRFSRTGNCPNSEPTYCRTNKAYSTSIWHEMGHWLNSRYGDQNDDNRTGFAEGSADVYAMYQSNFSIVLNNNDGEGCSFPPPPSPPCPSAGRDGNSTDELWCSDCESELTCGRDQHTAGEVLMGAFWKMRKQLGVDVDDPELGGDIADALFLGWMNAFDQNRIHSIIPYQLVLLDDDDHDWTTPSDNQAAIAHGFSAQGFPPMANPQAGEHVTTVICP